MGRRSMADKHFSAYARGRGDAYPYVIGHGAGMFTKQILGNPNLLVPHCHAPPGRDSHLAITRCRIPYL